MAYEIGPAEATRRLEGFSGIAFTSMVQIAKGGVIIAAATVFATNSDLLLTNPGQRTSLVIATVLATLVSYRGMITANLVAVYEVHVLEDIFAVVVTGLEFVLLLQLTDREVRFVEWYVVAAIWAGLAGTFTVYEGWSQRSESWHPQLASLPKVTRQVLLVDGAAAFFLAVCLGLAAWHLDRSSDEVIARRASDIGWLVCLFLGFGIGVRLGVDTRCSRRLRSGWLVGADGKLNKSAHLASLMRARGRSLRSSSS